MQIGKIVMNVRNAAREKEDPRYIHTYSCECVSSQSVCRCRCMYDNVFLFVILPSARSW
jgi:hypothetical protein